MVKVKACLEKMVRYSFTPVFLLDILPSSSAVYIASKIAQAKGYLSSDVEVKYFDIFKQVYKFRKEFYFPKEPLF